MYVIFNIKNSSSGTHEENIKQLELFNSVILSFVSGIPTNIQNILSNSKWVKYCKMYKNG